MTNNDGDNVEEVQEILEDIYAGTFIDTYVEESSNSNDPHCSKGKEDKFARLLRDTQRELYPSCTKFLLLSFLVKFLHIKTINNWSNKSFEMMLDLLKEALPPGERLPKSYYEAKKIIWDLGLGYEVIHVCMHDCVLFWKELEDKEVCPKCGESRWKAVEGKHKKIPKKVLRYFPLKPRLQRLFMSKKTAAYMRWHKEKRLVEKNVLRHPADSQAWVEFDKEHEWFAQEPRNVRLGLATDGFNPFSNMSNSYSMWPVVVVPYNLPPWKCMKEPFFMMSLLIPGPKSLRNDIDVYLRPLINELKELWENGVQTYDASTEENFQMHAAVLWTINDFPAYGNLSGWSTKGFLACPICNKDTCSQSLHIKIGYLCHRRYLPPDHSWRKKTTMFNNKQEHRLQPKDLSGDDVLEQLKNLEDVTFWKPPGKKKKKRTELELNWTKNSIFFELPYWRTLKLRHNLDVMHIEKNICDNVLGTLMNIDGKTKNTLKARIDLEKLGIKKELHLKWTGTKYEMPHACYTLSANERKGLCEWLKLVKFPDGYASNIS
ncbi:hypothetical protein L1049_014622 [Liquidambar formosana]|uniref:Transposase n=1 Tax=Liquidambar formosana TaxID=63359 RepID=A0AAP0RWM9_LIQFO